MTKRVQRLLMTALAFLLATSAVVLPGVAAGAAELPIGNPDPLPNPDLERSCGLNILMVLDESTSVANAGATGNVRDAFKAFTSALKNTSSSMAVAEFATIADLPAIGAFAPGDYITITDATKVDLDNYVDTGYNPTRFPVKYTNWEDGLRMGNPNFAVRPDPTVPHLTVFITDGDPNRIIKDSLSTTDYRNKLPLGTGFFGDVNGANENTAADNAIPNANGLKAQGSHILAIAVGAGLSSGASLNRLKLVSGPDIFDGTGAPFDIETDDIYVEPNFDELEDALREAAFQLCAPSLTIQKLVDETPDPDSFDDAYPGVNWQIDGTATAVGGYEWVLPSPGTGPSTKTASTDGAGFATFQWNTTAPVDSGFTATEVVQPGYTNDPSRTVCTFRTPDTPDAPLALDSVGDGTFSVTIPTEAIVTCTIVNIAEALPGITIEKATNGADADDQPGPLVPIGDPISWTYVVTNTGNTVLNDITVTDVETLPADAPGPVVTCPSTQLVQGEQMTCTATGESGLLASGAAFPEQYRNDATVTATDSTGLPVEATDPSHYLVSRPGISVEKSTNGVDADLVPGPLVVPGSQVDWQYIITNTGTVDLTDITLDDSIEGDVQITENCTWPVGVGVLQPGESATCNLTGTAIVGQYENVATATGFDPQLAAVSASDPSHYFGVTTGLTIEKATNGQDADLAYPDPDVPVVEVGSTVTWTYVVTNTGNVGLSQWDVVDDQGVAVSCPNVDIGPGASVTCNATGTAVAGPYANVATATATDPLGGEPLVATDPSHYFAATEEITVEKATNTQDADIPTGPFIPVGGNVDWTYVVTNTGTSTLSGVLVIDNDLGDVTDTCTISNEAPPWDGVLAPGESATCATSGTSVENQYSNVALAIGSGPFTDVGWVDPSHYFGTISDIIINKFTNGSDADTLPGIYVPVGDPIEWTYIVTNAGNNTISSIAVEDDLEGPIACDFTTLDVGGQGTCTLAGGPAILGQYSNVGSVTGIGADEVDLADDDPSNYFGYVTAIDVEKATNGQDVDTPTGPMVPVGDTVTWTYVVTNPGNVELSDVVLTDDQGVAPVFIGGDTNGDDLLDPDETWTYEATGSAVAGQYANVATVTGRDLFQDEATDTDPSHYFGVVSDITIEKATNGEDADTPTGPSVEVGDPLSWTYVVTNPGNVPLDNVTVTDDQGVTPVFIDGDTNGDGLLDPDETWTYEASGTAVAGQYANIGTATGLDPLERTVEATDPSHYLGFGAGIDIEKATNGDDADVAPGVQIALGEPVTWTYVVTNTGDAALSDIALVDDQGEVPTLVDGDTNSDGILDVGETWTFEATGTAISGQYSNLATVTGLDPVGVPVTDEDPSNYNGFVAGIDVEKATNGLDSDTAPGVDLLAGSTVTWTYVVTNTGDVPLPNVVLVDDQGEVPVFIDGDTNADSVLDPDEVWTYEATATATTGQYTNLATVTGTDPAGGTVTAGDPSNYNGVTEGLPNTGIDSDVMAIVALLLLAAGAVLVVLTRSRKRKPEAS